MGSIATLLLQSPQNGRRLVNLIADVEAREATRWQQLRAYVCETIPLPALAEADSIPDMLSLEEAERTVNATVS